MSDGQSPGRIWFSLTHKLKSRRARGQDSCVRLKSGSDCRPQGKRGSRSPGNDYILTTQFSQFTSFSPADGAAQRKQFCNPHPGTSRLHSSGSRRPRRAGHGADRNRQDARLLDSRSWRCCRRSQDAERGTGTDSAAHARTGHAGGAGLSRPSGPARSRPWRWWLAGCRSARNWMLFAAERG